MKASFIRYASNIKRALFSPPSKGTLGIVGAGLTYHYFHKAESAADYIAKKKGNLDIYRGLYTPYGENTMTGKRGTDLNNQPSGLVQGLHKNRRKY